MVGEQPGHGNQGEACIQFLFHAALALPMKVLNLHQPFGYLVPFLDDRIPATAVDEAVDIDTGFPLHPEHRVQHLIGIVSPVTASAQRRLCVV